MIILGIDPGYAIVGYGIVSYDRGRFVPLDYGAVTTPAGMDMQLRLKAIYDGISTLIEKYNPDAMSVEQLFFTNNQKTAIAVAEARGVIMLAAANYGIEFAEYTPLQVKQAVVGYGKAEKHQVMEMTRILLNLKSVPKPDDTADALAIAICHGHSSEGGTLAALSRNYK